MADRREQILVRYLELASEVTGFKTKVRNPLNIDDIKKDAVVLLDGDETQVAVIGSQSRASLMRPQIMRASPELFILLRETRPNNEENNVANVGTKLNDYRLAIFNKVATDPTLATLIGSNGQVIYNGHASDLKSGSSVSGTMRMDFQFDYPLIPSP